MYLHEYQAKNLLKEYGVPVAPFQVASSMNDVEEALAKGWTQAVLKIQVHAGGRGKAGGVKIARTPQEIREHAQKLIGMHLVNIQTGPEGVVAEKIILDTPVTYLKEYYLGIIIDRKNGGVCVIASAEGGMEIEEIASSRPEKIFVEQVADNGRLRSYQLNRLTKSLGWTGKIKDAGCTLIQAALKAFFALDATLLEINPLAQTEETLIALDAKLSLDDNALFRHETLSKLWDPSQLSKSEQAAHQHDLAYVALNGNIGCMVNGAGLAMATMDLIRYWGQEPANFLDVGGGASEEKVIEGFKILFSDLSVKVILVNIFGGIMNCEVIASALIRAVKEVDSQKQVIVRMEGTNVDSAKKMLAESKLHIITADSLDDAAKKATEAAKGT